METLSRTLEWFDTARPDPTVSTFNVQFGVHLEEVAETLSAIDPIDDALAIKIENAKIALEVLANDLKSGVHHIERADILRIPLLDGLCDTIVTSVGCAQALGWDIIGAMDEVNASNFSKFVNGEPVFKEGGKIAKGPDYRPPNLTPYIK